MIKYEYLIFNYFYIIVKNYKHSFIFYMTSLKIIVYIYLLSASLLEKNIKIIFIFLSFNFIVTEI